MQGSVLPAGKTDVGSVEAFFVGDNHYDVAVDDVFSHRGVAKVLFGDVLLPPTGERLFCRSDFARHLIVAVHHGIERRMCCHVIYIENLSPGEWLVGVVVFAGKALMLSIVDPRGEVMQSILICHIAILISYLFEHCLEVVEACFVLLDAEIYRDDILYKCGAIELAKVYYEMLRRIHLERFSNVGSTDEMLSNINNELFIGLPPIHL